MFVEHAIKEDINGSKGYYNPQETSETPYFYDLDLFNLGEMFALLVHIILS